MDKNNKKGKKKAITITKAPLATKLGGRNYYLINKFNGQYIDSNSTGDIFFNEENPDRENYHKWVFTNTETPGYYNIKNLKTELFLNSSDIGDINTIIFDGDSSYQKWIVMSTSEAESYVILNAGNNYTLFANTNDKIMMNILDNSQYEDLSNIVTFKIFQYKSKK